MKDLAWQYPAEPVEHATVQFCEAGVKWRGKPELETVSLSLAQTFVGSYQWVVQEETYFFQGSRDAGMG